MIVTTERPGSYWSRSEYSVGVNVAVGGTGVLVDVNVAVGGTDVFVGVNVAVGGHRRVCRRLSWRIGWRIRRRIGAVLVAVGVLVGVGNVVPIVSTGVPGTSAAHRNLGDQEDLIDLLVAKEIAQTSTTIEGCSTRKILGIAVAIGRGHEVASISE